MPSHQIHWAHPMSTITGVQSTATPNSASEARTLHALLRVLQCPAPTHSQIHQFPRSPWHVCGAQGTEARAIGQAFSSIAAMLRKANMLSIELHPSISSEFDRLRNGPPPVFLRTLLQSQQSQGEGPTRSDESGSELHRSRTLCSWEY